MQGIDKNAPQQCFINGAPVANNDNTLTVGPQGPTLLEDIWHLEKMAHFNREVLPERRMHAKGAGAFGTFTLNKSLAQYTTAKVLTETNQTLPIFIRFSTAGGERGSADAERDIRGFSVRFYTSQGNWDMVGNNTPVFFMRDPLRFPDLNHVLHRDQASFLRQEDNKWEFWTLIPEALHQVTITMSDRGIPKTYRHMHGFGSHTFSLLNDKGERHWVKFHFITQQGIENLTDDEAAAVIGKDRDSNIADLYYSIKEGNFPKWTMAVQIMTEQEAKSLPFNPFDLTKVWSHKTHPLINIGVIELNKNPDNYFADVECAGFTPANIVPGISFSPDKMLQSRLFSYGDAIRYRLGVNHFLMPVNRPKCPFSTFHRDGLMRTDGNLGTIPAFFPNDRGAWKDQRSFETKKICVCDCKKGSCGTDGKGGCCCDACLIGRWEDQDDHYQQPGDLFRLMSPEQQRVLAENTARSLGLASEKSQRRHIEHCTKADPNYGKLVQEALGEFKNAKL